MKINKRIKRALSIYNLAIFMCIVVIIASVITIISPYFGVKKITAEGIEIVQANVKSDEEINENDAKKLAVKQFKKLDEKDLQEDSINITKINRNGEEFYYAKSNQNTLELKVVGGEITRINSVVLE